MGVYDYITCRHPEVPPDVEWKTESMSSPHHERYMFGAVGTLWKQEFDYEDGSRINHRWEECRITGEIRFYTHTDSSDIVGSWIEYSAYFSKGQLIHIEQVTP